MMFNKIRLNTERFKSGFQTQSSIRDNKAKGDQEKDGRKGRRQRHAVVPEAEETGYNVGLPIAADAEYELGLG